MGVLFRSLRRSEIFFSFHNGERSCPHAKFLWERERFKISFARVLTWNLPSEQSVHKGADMELAIRALRSNVLPTLLAVSQQGAKSKDADCLFEPARPPFMEGFLLGSVYSDACSFCKAQSPSSPISPGSLTSSTHRHLQASGYRSLTVTLDGQLLLIRPKNGKLSFENRQCIERVCDKPLSLGSDWCVSSNILCPEEFTLTSLEPHEHHRILLFAHKHDAEAWRRRQELLKPRAHLLILVEM